MCPADKNAIGFMSMKNSLFIKIFTGFIFITILMSSCFLIFAFKTIKNEYIDTLAQDLENLGYSLLLTVRPYFENSRYKDLQTLVKEIGARVDKRITLITSDGTVVADSEKDYDLMENHRNRPEIMAALDGGIGRSLRYSTTMKATMLYIAVPIRSNNKVLGVLRLSIYLRSISRLLNSLKFRIFLISIIIIAVSLFIALLFSRRIIKPIRQLIIGTQRVADGDFDTKIRLKSRDELKELADNYNYMTAQLKKYMKELSFQKEELNHIISSMEPGLIVLDREDKIVLSNRSAQRKIGRDLAKGLYFQEVFSENKIRSLVQKVATENVSVWDEIRIGNAYYQITASPISAIQEIVLIFHDITDIKNLERIKRDFVANVSHELRTPLTAIKGYAETIEGVDEENRQYLDIIKRHTDRLINIVADLLTLSGLEEKGLELQIESVDIKMLLTNVTKMFDARILKKGLDIEYCIPEKLPPVLGDSIKLEQVFINLIDNALNYTENGKIRIEAVRSTGGVDIVVSDTGIGIPKKHLTRIFERFYTVDKSHSRRLGGTGLGLSIVKHIVLLHNGSIDVESIRGKGTMFRVRLPVYTQSFG
jgi:two-component system phosphate regulon sensor histidine kinase PhoR